MTDETGDFEEEIREIERRFSIKLVAFAEAQTFVLSSTASSLEHILEKKEGRDIGARYEASVKAFENLKTTLKGHDTDIPKYFTSILFLDFISSTEIFLIEIAQAVILKNPKKLGDTKFSLSEILDSLSKEDLISKASSMYMNKMMYKKPKEYLNDLCQTLSIDKQPLVPLWNNYVEAKARRDLGVHNNWKCNETYIRKITEIGINKTPQIGEDMQPDKADYSRETTKALYSLVYKISDAVIKKHG
jgi:hypothetical protein